MKGSRFRQARASAVVGATLLVAASVVGGTVGLGVVAPSVAGAAPISETMAGDISGTGTLYVGQPAGTTPAISFQPSSVAPGQNVTMSVASTSIQIPPDLAGQSVHFFTVAELMFPVPAGATYVNGSLQTSSAQWTFTNGGPPDTGPFDATECNSLSSPPHCNADPGSSSFLGSTSTPYIQVDTGPTHLGAGGTLVLPSWSAVFTATGPQGSSIEQTMSEFAADVQFTAGQSPRVAWYPSVTFQGNPTTPPAYQFQPVASASIGVAAPTISAVLPNSGPVQGGTQVTIHGTNLNNPNQVDFGSTPALGFTSVTSTTVSAVVPPSPSGPGTVDVQVFAGGGQTATGPQDQFTYTSAPIVTGVTPRAGPPSGGTQVAISGDQFTGQGPVTVRFGGAVASNVSVNSSTSITATTPPGAGVVDVTVQDAAGTSLTTVLDHFTYIVGYWFVASDGGIFNFGPPGDSPPFYGSMGGQPLNKPVVGMAATPDANGYWLVASDGGIFSFGDAAFFGSTGSMVLNEPIVGMASTPDGFGYWLVASDGGLFAFGDAQFYGSMGGTHLNEPVVGMAATPDGKGYWLVAADGGIFSFGDAGFFGSTGNIHLNRPVVGMTSTPDGHGYWFVASDGGIFAYGDAGFYGSTGSLVLNKPVVGMSSSSATAGYWLVAADGGVFSFGPPFYGSTGNLTLNKPVVGMAAPG
jgi:hypothetical protein